MIIYIEFANISKRNAKSNNVFDVKNMITSTRFVETTKNAIFMYASILCLNAEHSTNTKNVLIALTSILYEVFNATLKRKKNKNSTQFEIINRSCISKYRQTKTQRRQKMDFTSSRLFKCARLLRFNK